MPYITQKARLQYEKEIASLTKKLLEDIPYDQVDGNINYIFSSILRKIFDVDTGYFNYNRAIGILECVKQEYYRRALAPYEDKKIKENGDVY